MRKKIGPFDIYEYLPGLNCGDCGEETCIAFALKLLGRQAKLGECPRLEDEQRAKLREIVAPPVKEIVVGAGDTAVTIGGEEVLYRHELTFFNPTKLAVEIPDNLPEEKITDRMRAIEEFQIEIAGRKIGIDLITIGSASTNPETFSKTISILTERTKKPLILRSENPRVIEAGLELTVGKNPLIHAATAKNWGEMRELSSKYGCPVAISSADMAELKSLAGAFLRAGLKNIALDPVAPAGTLAQALDNLAMTRKAAIKGDEELGFPIVAGPRDGGLTSFEEVIFASIMMNRWASLLMMHTLDPSASTPLLTLRENIFTDPRATPSIKPGIYQFGRPNERSPVILTTNYTLTYYILAKDIRESGVDCYLLVVDTEGLSVENALAAKRIDGEKIARAIAEQSLGEKVKHRKLVIPGRLAKLKGEAEDSTGWEILVGPIHSKELGSYIRKIEYG